jgi:lipopolysaccharide heptosyltransferase I
MTAPIQKPQVRILLVKLSSLGDVVHALPTLEALRAAYPQAQITWLVQNGFSPLLHGHPALNEVWTAPRLRPTYQSLRREAPALAALISLLRSRPFDVAIDLQGLLKSALWVAVARSPRKVGFNGTREGSYLVLNERLPAYDPDLHAVRRYLQVAAYLGAAPPAPPRFRLPLRPSELANRLFSQAAARPVAVLHPGARWATKLWPAWAWADLGDWLSRQQDLQVVITGSPADQELTATIAARMQAPAINLAGRTSLNDLLQVLKGAALAVTTDTGPMHLAAALGLPLVALFGPTAPWRTGPFGQGHQVVRLDLSCSPCFQRRCPEPRCLWELPVAAVQAACEKVLTSGPCN